jgi:hypothetical protein
MISLMIDFESLAIADIYDWLGTGNSTGDYLCINQSTVSRNQKQFKALSNQLEKVNCLNLLSMERLIHQTWRLEQGRNLRLHAFRWMNDLLAEQSLEGWKLNPRSVSRTKKAVINLLEDRIIDAACAPFPLVASVDTEIFAITPLYRSRLQVLTDAAFGLVHEKGLRHTDIAAMTTPIHLPFVPEEAIQCSAQLDEMQFASGRANPTPSKHACRYWGMPLTPLIVPNLRALDYDTSTPYEEFLVVRKEWADHPRVSALRQNLIKSLNGLLATVDLRGELEVVA